MKIDVARAAREKIDAGALLTIKEVAAVLSVDPMTVHKLPIPSIRMSRNLRFDPKDVIQLIESSKEPTLA